MKCPQCGTEEKVGIVCRCCNTNFIDYITKEDYRKYLTAWSENEDEFLREWDRSVRGLFIDMEFESENDSKLSRELEAFKKKMSPKPFDAESNATAYLSDREVDIEGFKKYLSAVTDKRIVTAENQSDIFAYYVKLIKYIKIKYADIKREKHFGDLDKRLTELYSEIVGNANKILEKVCTNKVFRPNTNRFRRFRSSIRPQIHDEYCKFLMALNDAVLSAGSELVKHVFAEVK